MELTLQMRIVCDIVLRIFVAVLWLCCKNTNMKLKPLLWTQVTKRTEVALTVQSTLYRQNGLSSAAPHKLEGNGKRA